MNLLFLSAWFQIPPVDLVTGISLTSQNSSCTKEDCGRQARAALKEAT